MPKKSKAISELPDSRQKSGESAGWELEPVANRLIEIQKLIENQLAIIHKRIPDNTEFITSWDNPENQKIDRNVIYFLWSKEDPPNHAALIFNSIVPVQIYFNPNKITKFCELSGKIAELFLADEVFLDKNTILAPFVYYLDNIMLHEIIEYYCKKYGIEVSEDEHDGVRRLVRYYQKNPNEKLKEEKIRSEFNGIG